MMSIRKPTSPTSSTGSSISGPPRIDEFMPWAWAKAQASDKLAA
jgi:hypothetical protein